MNLSETRPDIESKPRPSTSPTLKLNNYELQLNINEKSPENLVIETDNNNNDINDQNDNVEANEANDNDDVLVDENAGQGGLDEHVDVVKVDESLSRVDNNLPEKLEDTAEFVANSFNEKKKVYFDKHNLSNEYEKITSYEVSDVLFETKTKKDLIKTFRFNANSKTHIKNLKFNYSETACQNNHNLLQAKMSFYDTLLNKGDLIIMYLMLLLWFALCFIN